MDDTDQMTQAIEALETSMGGAAQMAAAFDGELRRIHGTFSATGHGLDKLEQNLSRGIGKAVDGVVLHGDKLSDALKNVSNAMINTAYKAAVQPVSDHFAGLLTGGIAQIMGGLNLFAQGGAFSQGKVMPFAKGGVVSSPVSFPMRGGTGLMGEAGPEAIMPLTRGPDGALGVRAQGGGGGPVNVVMNIQTPDADSFRRSQSQISASMGRALSRGQRNR